MGGRRPKTSSNLSPEEEEKRRVRRERNKLAAARCRKRRVDQTNDLMEKVILLETEKKKLECDIHNLQTEKEELEFILQSHRSQCKLALGQMTKIVNIKPKMEFKEPSNIPLDKIKVEIEDSYEDRDSIAPPPTKRVLLSMANPVIGGAVSNPSINIISTGKPSRPR